MKVDELLFVISRGLPTMNFHVWVYYPMLFCCNALVAFTKSSQQGIEMEPTSVPQLIHNPLRTDTEKGIVTFHALLPTSHLQIWNGDHGKPAIQVGFLNNNASALLLCSDVCAAASAFQPRQQLKLRGQQSSNAAPLGLFKSRGSATVAMQICRYIPWPGRT